MKRVIVNMILLMSFMQLNAQTDTVDSLLIDLFGNDKTMSHIFDQPSRQSFFYSGINIDSKTFYAGRELGENMYSANANIYLFHSSGLYFGATGSWYSQLDPRYSSTTVTAGVRGYLTRSNNFSIRASYSRFFFTPSELLTYIPFKNSVGAGLLLKNDWIGASLSYNLFFGEESVMNLTPEVFGNITLVRFGRSGRIHLNPDMSAFFGTETITTISSLTDTLNSTYTTAEKYGLLNIQAFLPLCISFSGFSIEAGYNLNFPRTKDRLTEYLVSSSISFSVSYVLPLNW